MIVQLHIPTSHRFNCTYFIKTWFIYPHRITVNYMARSHSATHRLMSNH